MKYIEVYPMEILQGMTAEESYILMLMEPRSNKNVPILIGNAEAQSIIMAQEELQGQRPSTHELMQHTMEAFALTLKEVTIERFVEGVFYALLHVSDGFYEKQVDSRSSDAIALALRWRCPIRMSEAVIQEVGFDADEKGESRNDEREEKGGKQGNLGKESREELERMLHECEENEEYELAEEIAKRLKALGEE